MINLDRHIVQTYSIQVLIQLVIIPVLGSGGILSVQLTDNADSMSHAAMRARVPYVC